MAAVSFQRGISIHLGIPFALNCQNNLHHREHRVHRDYNPVVLSKRFLDKTTNLNTLSSQRLCGELTNTIKANHPKGWDAKPLVRRRRIAGLPCRKQKTVMTSRTLLTAFTVVRMARLLTVTTMLTMMRIGTSNTI